ncbi:carbohydrate ABC transporter substrate-binding protein, CUT1 family [Gracilibacillus ureilyticus]|uniref:Carbohydrate ABC transporter substrate-binding protein, CUT1 family n=1 Tax=Gracilibacillus ureilyticus TaxID=531814 RepID=A0A1H9PS33_9BACI|nr:extracellular solute-binding protein [Gracilibacillus ureilyticus]SER50918.1 carbohydrate ABC transporter substrate-binding protein, CUT1 family [Gracilibacillus ureilyticus]
MSKQWKKLLVTFMLLFVLGILTACNDSDADSDGEDTSDGETSGAAMEDYGVGDTFKATEPVTFTTLFSDHPNYPIKDDWMLFEKIKELTNVELDITAVPFSDYADKRSLLISSGDAPYIIPKTYPGEETPFVSSGAILPISDYVDMMPHYQDKVEKWEIEPFLEGLRQQDGKYYVLPGLHENVWPDYSLAIRTDILEELGLEEPKTWEELEVVLEEMKKAYPDSIPFSDRFKFDSTLNIAAVGFDTQAGWGLGNMLDYQEDTDEFIFSPATENYRSMVEYFHGLVEKGLLDPESVTQEDEPAVEKFTSGKSFVINTNGQTLTQYRDTMDESLGADNYSIKKIVVPGGPAGDLMTGSKLENGIMFSAAAKDDPNFETMLQFIDWMLYSDEGLEFNKWGVEGETYTKENGEYVLAEDITFRGMNPDAEKDLQIDFGFSGGNFSYGGPTELLHSMFNEEEIEFQNAMLETKELVLPDPPIKYDAMQLEQSSLLSTPLKDHVTQNTLKFIVGERSLDEWDTFVQELEAKNMQGYVDLANQVYQESK